MPIIRKRIHEDFTIIPNKLLRDERLNFGDVGLLCYLLMLPDDWEFSIAGLVVARKTDGKAAVSSSIKRIEVAGYMKRERERLQDGRVGRAIWTISNEPMESVESPKSDFPTQEKPTQENKPQTKKVYNKENTYKGQSTEYKKAQQDVALPLEEEPTKDTPKFEKPKKRETVRSRIVARYGEDDVESAMCIVNYYIDKWYPYYRKKDHDKVDRGKRYCFAEKILKCRYDLGFTAQEIADVLHHAVRDERVYDPTIYHVTRDRVLGMWSEKERDFSILIGTDYDYEKNKGVVE